MKWGIWLLAALVIVGCDSGKPGPHPDWRPAASSNASPTAQAAVEKAPAPSHFYSAVDGQKYLYERALSDDDARSGVSSPDMVSAIYLGEKNGEVQVLIDDGPTSGLLECTRPCDVIKVRDYFQSRPIRMHYLKNDGQSIAAEIIADALGGQLTQFVGKDSGSNSRTHAWADRDGIVRISSAAPN